MVMGVEMKWFKHMTNARDDEFISEMIDEFGLESYGRWWILLEIISSGINGDSTQAKATYPVNKWQRLLLHYHKIRLNRWLIFLESSKKVLISFDKIKPNLLTIEIPKLLKIRDEYSSRKK